MKFVLTAGFDKSIAVIALAELLRRQGHRIHSVVVVSPFSLRRLRALIRQRGVGGVRKAWQRMLGRQKEGTASDPVLDILQLQDLSERSIRSWTNLHDAGYLTTKDVNSRAVSRWIKDADPDYVIYGGGGILRREFLQSAKRGVLNAHSGPLPEIRGMNACEWSLLLGVKPAVTIHFIDEGIDTGATIMKREVDVVEGDSIDTLRSKCVAYGVETLVDVFAGSKLDEFSLPDQPADPSPGRQCFVLAPVLRELLEHRLAAKK